ncbi:MAG: hypothetical protein JO270_08615 [Acidobacteriaceae bacterium]|nr:hypothetical protein [Acidobacteriaceae bacterium]
MKEERYDAIEGRTSPGQRSVEVRKIAWGEKKLVRRMQYGKLGGRSKGSARKQEG